MDISTERCLDLYIGRGTYCIWPIKVSFISQQANELRLFFGHITMLIPVVFALSYSASTVLYKHHLSHNKRCRCHDNLFVSCILSAVHEIQQSDFGYDSLFSCSLATNIYATFIKHLCKHTHTDTAPVPCRKLKPHLCRYNRAS